ncbi:class I SAM-dependent methyltransferase [Rhodoplanes sp. Z2-YC6860]|uniref:class I SAM-dependent methyltransferase n=1 Tax=Rhodoplanes sp. Z2-YC6860 TaxID=674703 RepID=UPI00078B9B5F|nr:methyltransferase domain-containing protein [Rhodoplanes sp. Z2-YC6860]AMN43471.1 3-demethylubiquinone-9 3-methyltransferase [Rhodoplanes sp. Z2-YC6860]
MTEIAFDKYATKGGYHWVEYFGPLHRINAATRARYDGIVAALRANGIGKSSRVLDVGCGDAALTGLIATEFGAQVEGIDTTPLSIDLAKSEFAKRSLKGEFRLIDGYKYPYPADSFDAVVCSDVIEHVAMPDLMLREMWRVLKPSGVLVVTTPARYTEAPLDPMHVQEWFAGDFKKFCEAALGTRVDLRVSHPIAVAELYALPTMLGRVVRLSVNLLAKLGTNAFSRPAGFRAFSAQMVVAVKHAGRPS